MKGINKIENLNNVKKRKYVGYIWMSDKQEPKVLTQPTEFDFSKVGANPFVQEALLYCNEGNEEVSITVRHTGVYQITEFDLKNLPQGAELNEREYFPHRLGFQDKRVFIKQLWFPEPDPNCDGMEVLTLKAHIFTGFVTPKK